MRNTQFLLGTLLVTSIFLAGCSRRPSNDTDSTETPAMTGEVMTGGVDTGSLMSGEIRTGTTMDNISSTPPVFQQSNLVALELTKLGIRISLPANMIKESESFWSEGYKEVQACKPIKNGPQYQAFFKPNTSTSEDGIGINATNNKKTCLETEMHSFPSRDGVYMPKNEFIKKGQYIMLFQNADEKNPKMKKQISLKCAPPGVLMFFAELHGSFKNDMDAVVIARQLRFDLKDSTGKELSCDGLDESYKQFIQSDYIQFKAIVDSIQLL